MREFKIGDRVRNSKYGEGTIKHIDIPARDNLPCAVEFDNYHSDLHNCSTHAESNRGFWCGTNCSEREAITLIEEEKQMSKFKVGDKVVLKDSVRVGDDDNGLELNQFKINQMNVLDYAVVTMVDSNDNTVLLNDEYWYSPEWLESYDGAWIELSPQHYIVTNGSNRGSVVVPDLSTPKSVRKDTRIKTLHHLTGELLDVMVKDLLPMIDVMKRTMQGDEVVIKRDKKGNLTALYKVDSPDGAYETGSVYAKLNPTDMFDWGIGMALLGERIEAKVEGNKPLQLSVEGEMAGIVGTKTPLVDIAGKTIYLGDRLECYVGSESRGECSAVCINNEYYIYGLHSISSNNSDRVYYHNTGVYYVKKVADYHQVKLGDEIDMVTVVK